MRKIVILFAVFVPWILASCYQDKGNYDYGFRTDITVDLDSSYTKVSLQDTLDIIVHPMPEDDYEYLWLLSGTSLDLDTLGTEPHLQWKVNMPQGQYDLYLQLTSKSDGYVRLFSSKLWVTSDYSDGWFVLKEQEGATELDFYSLKTDGGVVRNILVNAVGRKMSGQAGDMALVLGVYLPNPDNAFIQENLLWMNSTEDAWLLRVSDMSVYRDYSEMFYGDAPAERPIWCMAYGYRGNLICSGKDVFYANNQGFTTLQAGMPLEYKKEKEIGGYGFWDSYGGYYFYDEANQRFLAASSNGSAITFETKQDETGTYLVDVNNTGCSMLYMGINDPKNSKQAYALMKNETGENYVYILNVNQSLGWGVPYNPITEVWEMNSQYVNEATHFAIHASLPYIYYTDATGERIHYYDIIGNSEVTDAISFPSGEKVTFMKALFFKPTNGEGGFEQFVVATEKDGHYKIYLYDLPAGKPTTEPQILEGEGKVSSVQRISKTMSQNSSPLMSGNCGIGLFN